MEGDANNCLLAPPPSPQEALQEAPQEAQIRFEPHELVEPLPEETKNIVVVGFASSGKTTLLKWLLGDDLPCPVEIFRTDGKRAMIVVQHGDTDEWVEEYGKNCNTYSSRKCPKGLRFYETPPAGLVKPSMVLLVSFNAMLKQEIDCFRQYFAGKRTSVLNVVMNVDGFAAFYGEACPYDDRYSFSVFERPPGFAVMPVHNLTLAHVQQFANLVGVPFSTYERDVKYDQRRKAFNTLKRRPMKKTRHQRRLCISEAPKHEERLDTLV